MHQTTILATALGATLIFTACGCQMNDWGENGAAFVSQPPGLSGLSAQADEAGEAESVIQPRWAAIEPGGDAICARGTPFRFFVRRGDPRKVVIHFDGGGACWDEQSCAKGSPFFKDDIPSLDEFLAVLELDFIGGLQQVDDPALPTYGWTYVHIPYCTGDIHLGDATTEYGDVSIEHRGATNVRSALGWLAERYPALDDIMMNGCSAGSYGAYFHAPSMADRYPGATLRVLGDGGAGVVSELFFAGVRQLWGVTMPSQVPALQAPLIDGADFFASIAAAYPDDRFAIHTTAFDANQTMFYLAAGGQPGEWPELMRQVLGEIGDRADNFRHVIAPGPTHCVTPYEHLWTRQVEDVTLASWLTSWLYDDELPDNLSCEGEACLDDALCDSCVPDDVRSFCQYCAAWPY
ncbi:MAG: hypothetical protein Tsb0020_11650 [Haliangiales bacterium]